MSARYRTRAPGTMGVPAVLWRVATTGSRPGCSGRPSSPSRAASAWYSAVTPSSLKRLAMVPNTGIWSGGVVQASRLRCTCLATSRSASRLPLRSNLLIATKAAKSSMSIFSSWLAAPNSGVITYIGTSTSGTMAASPWPMPEVSTTMRSKPAAWQAASTSGRAWLISLPKSRVASERMNTRGPDDHGEIGIHADAVAQQRTAALAAAGVDADHGDVQAVALVQPQAADQLVGQAALAGAAGAGDAEHRRVFGLRRERGLEARIGAAVFQRRDGLCQRTPCGGRVALQRGDVLGRVRRQVVVGAHQHLADHAGQAHALAVFGAVDARHAIGLQRADLVRHDDPAATAEDLDVAAAQRAQPVHHVLEVLGVAALVAADRDALHVLLQRGRDHLVHRAVVAQVDDLGAHALQQPPHDVDGRVVAVEQAGGGDKTHLVRRAVVGEGLGFGGEIGHGGGSESSWLTLT